MDTNNPFATRSSRVDGIGTDLVPVVPDDAGDLSKVAVSLYVETGGDIVITTQVGGVRTIKVADYSILPVGVKRVHATGTTATGIHAFTVT